MTNIIKSTDARACYLMSVSKCSDWEQFRQGLPMIPMTLPQKELKSLHHYHHFHPQMHFPQRAGSGSLWYVEVWAPMCMHIRHEMLNSLEQDSQSAAADMRQQRHKMDKNSSDRMNPIPSAVPGAVAELNVTYTYDRRKFRSQTSDNMDR